MSTKIIVDTGALIAFLLPKDKFHTWAVTQFSNITNDALWQQTSLFIAYYGNRCRENKATSAATIRRQSNKPKN